MSWYVYSSNIIHCLNVFYFKIAVNSVLGLEEGKESFIVGTLYKHMKLKLSILDEYSKDVLLY
jgi:DNA polymerase delta subunit 2